jgi:hypothetical protein
MGISKKIVGSGLIVLTILCCQFIYVPNTCQDTNQQVPVELTGTVS